MESWEWLDHHIASYHFQGQGANAQTLVDPAGHAYFLLI